MMHIHMPMNFCLKAEPKLQEVLLDHQHLAQTSSSYSDEQLFVSSLDLWKALQVGAHNLEMAIHIIGALPTYFIGGEAQLTKSPLENISAGKL